MQMAWWLYVGVVWAAYDEYMTCGSGSERYGRHFHHYPELPCDITKNSWCESAGNQYPWGAVRRFIYENQGLMKRMYGTQRHYNVLRTELLNNLYDEMYDEMPKRQHQYRNPSLGSARSPRYQNPSRSNTLNSHSAKLASKQRDRLNSRAIKVTMEPEYTSNQRQTHTTAKPKSQSKATNIQDETPTTSRTTKVRDSAPLVSTDTTKSTRTTSRHSTVTRGTTTTNNPLSTTEDVPATANDHQVELDKAASLTREYFSVIEEGTEPTLIPLEHQEGADPMDMDTWTTLSDFSTDATSSLYTTSLGHSSETESSYISITESETSTPASLTTHSQLFRDDLEDEDGFFSEGFISTPLDEDDLTTLTLGDRVDQGVKIHGDGVDHYTKDEIDLGIEEALSEDENVGGFAEENKEISDTEDGTVESEDLGVELREQVAYDLKLEENVREEVKTESTGEPIKVKRPLRGINACPVKEEFVAPYWANNTRGETLALLNLYPFEQYVQWERCKYEHRQMYCRSGCRCEQQYRLHKLLAFDPSNECRGIFSDWFRFPSCCVCKCYDLPQDIFTTSARRPRLNKDGDEDDKDYVDDDDDDVINKEEKDDSEDEQEHLPIKPGPPLANIPPQRRPRLPPRPVSHISPPLSPPLPSPSHVQFSKQSNTEAVPTDSPEVSTLGTLDVATPHYFFNLTNYAHIRFAKGQPLPLSRVPRSPKA